MFTLQDLASEIAANVDFMNNVVVIGPELCPRCTMTGKLLDKVKIPWEKYVIEDRMHPLIVALRERVGVEPGTPVEMPMVFIKGVFSWNDHNPAEISNYRRTHRLAA